MIDKKCILIKLNLLMAMAQQIKAIVENDDMLQNVSFIDTDKIAPEKGQAVWVRHRNGAEYRLTYPFKHEDYPLWYPLPK